MSQMNSNSFRLFVRRDLSEDQKGKESRGPDQWKVEEGRGRAEQSMMERKKGRQCEYMGMCWKVNGSPIDS